MATKKDEIAAKKAEKEANEVRGLNLYEKLALVSERVGALGKDLKAPDKIGGFKYRGTDQIEDALRPQFIHCRLVAIPSIAEHDTVQHGKMLIMTANVSVEFVNLDNLDERYVVTTVAQGMDTGDKAAGKVLAYGTKNIYLSVFHLKGQPDNEADAAELSDSDEKYNTGQPCETIPTGRHKGKAVGTLDDKQLSWIASHWAKSMPDVALAAQNELNTREAFEAEGGGA